MPLPFQHWLKSVPLLSFLCASHPGTLAGSSRPHSTEVLLIVLSALRLSLPFSSLMFRPCFPKCRICARPGFLFGSRDPETGWMGWCRICCLHWKYRHPKSLTGFKIFKDKDVVVVELIMRFLFGDLLTHDWLSGELLLEVRRANQMASYTAWRRYLLGGSMAVTCPLTGKEWEPGTSDEDEDGSFPNTLNFRNPLQRLAVSTFETYDPFKIVVDMLGPPL